MPKLIRKTSTMTMMEYKFGKPIDELIIGSMVDHHGSQLDASNSLGISPSTMSRWIKELDLTRHILKIRRDNGATPTTNDLSMEISGQEVIELAVKGRCLDKSECNKKLEEFVNYTITYVDKLPNPFKPDGNDRELIAVVRDELNIKHWFSLDLSTIAI